jgi:hypothetical protein
MSQMTKLEIIEELFDNYYVKDPSKRAANGSICSYYQERTGNKCAVGMCMLDDDTAIHYQNTCTYSNVCGIETALEIEGQSKFDDILKERYRGHDLHFWLKVQQLHDNSGFWSAHGLSDAGVDELALLKEVYLM